MLAASADSMQKLLHELAGVTIPPDEVLGTGRKVELLKQLQKKPEHLELILQGFNWDPQRKIVTAEKAVWDAYIQDVRNDVDDNMAFSHTRQMHPKTSNSSSRKRGRDEDSEDSVESLKELAILIVREMKESSSRLSRAIGQEINDKQVGLNGELKKITSLTTVERLKATTLIARDNAALNGFYSLSDEDRKVWVKLFLSGEI
ncbi:hypothetical protein WN944_024526 [Citrus x changshan-huyou]|uniref:Uncharacterized protein n=1 Tax=Citrus x changshan-huyou TaxID=2935761 RepID=A0AAP0LN51_9ROSI